MLKLRNILIIIAIFVILKFIGQVMKAKTAAKQHDKDERERQRLKKRKEFVEKNSGKTFVLPKDSDEISDVEDVEHEEVN